MHPLFKHLQEVDRLGEIEQSIGLKLIANGPPNAFIGEISEILDLKREPIIQAEVIGFDKGKVFLMPFGNAPISMGLHG